MFKRKERNNDIIEVLMKENKRLKRENASLKELQADLEKYRDDYKALTEHMAALIKKYMQEINEMHYIEKEYKQTLEEIIKEIK